MRKIVKNKTINKTKISRSILAFTIILSFLAFAFTQSYAQDANAAAAAAADDEREKSDKKLTVTVTDENGVPVSTAHLTLVRANSQTLVQGETDSKGRRDFTELSAGLYRLKIEKQGFYAIDSQYVNVGQAENLDITINHEQEVRDSVNVSNSSPTIDLAKTDAGQELSNTEIVNIPYTVGRDYRNILPFVPGVVRDNNGNLHINGAASNQINNEFDGFSTSHPASGLLELRVSPDALRSIDVKSSRYSAEYGKGSAGIVGLTTGMGDDRFRFNVTDFIPSPQLRKGLNFGDWTPRATFSGPLRKQKAWFFDAFDGEYGINIVEDLPKGNDRGRSYRANNIAKAQFNLTNTNILTTSILVNRYNSTFDGLSVETPIDATRDLRQSAYLYTIKDQAYFTGGMVMEFGVGFNQFTASELPHGDLPDVRFPGRREGNYFRTTEGVARRLQFIGNLTFPTLAWHGRHEFKVGADFDRVFFQQLEQRRPILIERDNGTLSREIDYINNPAANRYNFEASGYGQDRWSISDRWLMEVGLRYDWDEIIRDVLVSPRFASTYMLHDSRETKLSAGIGIYYDTTNLSYLTQPETGSRIDTFFAKDGVTAMSAPILTTLQVNEDQLRAPRFINWSLGVEDKLPASVYMRLDFLGRRGRSGLAFLNTGPELGGQPTGFYQLGSFRRDRYDAVQITLRRKIKQNYMVFMSYTRSNARSNATFEYDIDNPIFSQQAGGPLSWDTPNRFISWGWLPFFKGFDLSYTVDWRDGFPFSVVDGNQQLIGPPNYMRFPDYFSVNLHAEKRFHLIGKYWAVRGGFNNLTNRPNPSEVDNNMDSPTFLRYFGPQKRAFVGRIRFLGKK
ncbi:MAG: TonB-dependent receptor [Blastocatellia bacterium]|nr:TonB-dependent receptor [Blastocatellia bacterium]